MKRIASLVLVFMALLVIAPKTTAQTVNQQQYVVQQGDTLYALRGIYSPDQPEWKAIIIAYPQLAERGRSYRDDQGRFIVVIRPGDNFDFTRLGVTADTLPLDALKLGNTTTVPLAQQDSTSKRDVPWWLWPLVVITLLLLAGAALTSILRGRTGGRHQLELEFERYTHELATAFYQFQLDTIARELSHREEEARMWRDRFFAERSRTTHSPTWPITMSHIAAIGILRQAARPNQGNIVEVDDLRMSFPLGYRLRIDRKAGNMRLWSGDRIVMTIPIPSASTPPAPDAPAS